MKLARSLGALAIVLSTLAMAGPAQAAVLAFDSEYLFESAFLGNLGPGDSGAFSVFFANTGATAWGTGSVTQVNLAACLDDKVTCNVAPEEAAWNPGTWLSATAYATHTKGVVAPGDFSAFTYNVRAPASASIGVYRFNGDLVVAATGAKVHPQGYYQDAAVTSAGAAVSAPSDVQVQVANLNNGPKDDDVHIFFTAPSTNPLMSYDIQRAPGSCPVAPDHVSWALVTSLTLTGGVSGSYTDLDRQAGVYCYQVRVKSASGAFRYSNQVRATVFGAAPDATRPISTSATLTNDSGFTGTLDAGDQFRIVFSKEITVASNARIRVTDADCGAPASQSSGPASCTAPVTQTVSDIVCGTNANCVLSFDSKSLTVTMTSSPIDVTSGAAPGTQFPVVITDSTGIGDATGNVWSIVTSSDRVFGPLGQ